MAERFDYPTAAAPTTSFVPAIDGAPAGSPERLSLGIVPEQSAGNAEYSYDEGVEVLFIARRYVNNSRADRNSFETFIRTAGGATFSFTDYQGTVHNLVTFADFEPQFDPGEADKWSWTTRMRKAL